MYLCPYYIDSRAWTKTWNVSERQEIPVSEEAELWNNNSNDGLGVNIVIEVKQSCMFQWIRLPYQNCIDRKK